MLYQRALESWQLSQLSLPHWNNSNHLPFTFPTISWVGQDTTDHTHHHCSTVYTLPLLPQLVLSLLFSNTVNHFQWTHWLTKSARFGRSPPMNLCPDLCSADVHCLQASYIDSRTSSFNLYLCTNIYLFIVIYYTAC